jgi:hypothetical protein
VTESPDEVERLLLGTPLEQLAGVDTEEVE